MTKLAQGAYEEQLENNILRRNCVGQLGLREIDAADVCPLEESYLRKVTCAEQCALSYCIAGLNFGIFARFSSNSYTFDLQVRSKVR